MEHEIEFSLSYVKTCPHMPSEAGNKIACFCHSPMECTALYFLNYLKAVQVNSPHHKIRREFDQVSHHG